MSFFKNEVTKTLEEVLKFWSTKVIDKENGGFYGALDFYGNPLPENTKGIILNARLLWSFAKASNYLETDTYTFVINKVYEYLKSFFKDKTYGGIYWEVSYKGELLNSEKKSIAQAYTLLALSETYIFSKKEEIKNWSINLYEFIEANFYNTESNYYYDSLTRELGVLGSESKSLGTHLHILEAYTSLYKTYKNEKLKERIENLLTILTEKFLHNDEFCELNFDANWNSLTQLISLGHNVEVPCILLDACKQIKTEQYTSFLKDKLKSYSKEIIHLVEVAGGVYQFKDVKSDQYTKEFQWWMQTESIIAFKELYKLTPKEKYLQSINNIWSLVKNDFIDRENGEWHEKLDANKKPILLNKVDMWKSPYHIIRMCVNI